MFNDFFIGKHVLVTGVAGTKGVWLALMLLDSGARVTGLDKRLPPPRSNFSASGLGSRISFVHGDVRDFELMRRLIEETDCVFHLAAEAIVGEAVRNPFETYSSNTLGTATVLEALRTASAPKRCVCVTTDKVYRPKGRDLWIESDELGASGPYAVSKACAELLIRDYHRTYFAASETKIAVGRAGNVVIGGDHHDSKSSNGAGRIFVDCYEALIEGRSPQIFRPGFTRPYTYGLDIISGYMLLMSLLEREGIAGEAFNFGPYEQFGVSNGLLATKICDLWGSGVQWQTGAPRAEPFEFQSLSIEKSRQRLRWSPAYTLYEALRATTDWYKTWARLGADVPDGCMYGLNCSLIAEHRSAAARLGIEWATSADRNAS